MLSRPLLLATLAVIPLFCSCGDTSELDKQNLELDAQIEGLEDELATKKKLLREDVLDVGEELDQAAAQIQALTREAARMESELVDLRDEKESLELRFSEYRKKYPIN